MSATKLLLILSLIAALAYMSLAGLKYLLQRDTRTLDRETLHGLYSPGEFGEHLAAPHLSEYPDALGPGFCEVVSAIQLDGSSSRRRGRLNPGMTLAMALKLRDLPKAGLLLHCCS